jgi:hypothetical protein
VCLPERTYYSRKNLLACESMKTCTLCGSEFEPTKNNIRKGFWNCPECCNAKLRDYRARRKAAGFKRKSYSVYTPARKIYNRTIARLRWRNPLERPKMQARYALNQAVRKGRIRRQNCSNCGTDKNVQGHHVDYTKPLEVAWLCRSCHSSLHHGSHCDALG